MFHFYFVLHLYLENIFIGLLERINKNNMLNKKNIALNYNYIYQKYII